ncbi:hypothetical protein FRC09_013510, partial [Ceratobasidium sp. 395]
MRQERQEQRHEARKARPYRVTSSRVLGESGGRDPTSKDRRTRRLDHVRSSARVHALSQPWDDHGESGSVSGRGGIAWAYWCDATRVRNVPGG